MEELTSRKRKRSQDCRLESRKKKIRDPSLTEFIAMIDEDDGIPVDDDTNSMASPSIGERVDISPQWDPAFKDRKRKRSQADWQKEYRAKKKMRDPSLDKFIAMIDEDDDMNINNETKPIASHSTGDGGFQITAGETTSSDDDAFLDILKQSTPSESEDIQEIWHLIDSHETLYSDSELSCEEDDEQKEDEEEISLCDQLRMWKQENKMSMKALEDNMHIWRSQGFLEVPKCARTLMKTETFTPVSKVSGCDYTYLGLQKMLLANFERYTADMKRSVEHLEISLNIDGLPLFRSSKNSVWPVLCGIMNMTPNAVFPVALAYGKSKPDNLDFLQDVLADLKTLLANGLNVSHEKNLPVRLRCVVCDAPAKALVKGTKLCSGYSGCDKCEQHGTWQNKVVYLEITGSTLRTDESFRQQRDKKHHLSVSPFVDLQIDLIKCFAIDYMHQVLIGVMKRLILVWMRGPRMIKVSEEEIRPIRISASQVEVVSNKLCDLQVNIPDCFVRKPRRLTDIDYWKATEFRLFLLYTGRIVLKDVLPEDMYQNYLVLSVAITILLSTSMGEEQHDYAQSLLEYFISEAIRLYGEQIMVYNMHSLLHITEEAREFGSLDNCSAFLFENHLRVIKQYVQSGRHVVQQIARRASESLSVPIEQKQKFVKTTQPNNTFLLENGNFCEIVRIHPGPLTTDKPLLCRVYSKRKAKPLFDHPCDSRMIGTAVVSEKDSKLKHIKPSDLDKPAIMIRDVQKKTATFMAVIHDSRQEYLIPH